MNSPRIENDDAATRSPAGMTSIDALAKLKEGEVAFLDTGLCQVELGISGMSNVTMRKRHRIGLREENDWGDWSARDTFIFYRLLLPEWNTWQIRKAT